MRTRSEIKRNNIRKADLMVEANQRNKYWSYGGTCRGYSWLDKKIKR